MNMEVRYNPSLVLLSVLVAILASYVALNLAHSVTQAKGKAQAAWLACGAAAMGVGIWSMHFVGMLAFEMPGMEMAYDVPLMTLSVLVAVVASALALFVVSRPTVHSGSLLSSGIAMAAAISGMHYIGMYSMRMQAQIEWNVYLVLLSIAIALCASFAALTIAIRLRNKPDRTFLLGFASVLMGIAISGMHYTGMVAATFRHDSSMQIGESNLLVSSGLSVAVISTTLLILGIALASSVGQRLLRLRQLALGNSEERFRILVEAVKDYAIYMLDPDGFITTWNSGAERITGYRESEIVGQHVSKLYLPEDVQADLASSELRIAREQGHFEVDALRMRKDGTAFWANIALDPMYSENGTLTGYSKVTRDITQLREAAERTRSLNEELERRVNERTLELREREAQLQSAKEAAEVANATKSAFLANMSHEIRTPLGAVLGFSELMLNGEMTPSERFNAAEIIKRNGKLLSTIINDILDLSKVEAGKLEMERVDVHLAELLRELATLLSLEAEGKGIRFTVSSEGVIPTIIRTDPTRLRQILFNLAGNAIKFTEKGSVDLCVKLSSRGDNQLEFVVTDTGTGIAPEKIGRLFSPFTQADATTTRRFGGTGLGLVLSQKLAQALGGDVRLKQTSVGKGSTFIASIHHGQSQEVLFESNASRQAHAHKVLEISSREKSKELSKSNILVVEDSSDNSELIKRILLLAGANVDIARNGKEGIEKALSGNYNIVLMDLQMPEMDGYEATKELRRQGFKQPIIALTAHAMKEERKRCLETGFNNHLTKPIDRQSLIHALAEYTG